MSEISIYVLVKKRVLERVYQYKIKECCDCPFLEESKHEYLNGTCRMDYWCRLYGNILDSGRPMRLKECIKEFGLKSMCE